MNQFLYSFAHLKNNIQTFLVASQTHKEFFNLTKLKRRIFFCS